MGSFWSSIYSGDWVYTTPAIVVTAIIFGFFALTDRD